MNTLILAAAKPQIEDDKVAVFSMKLIYSKSIKICLFRVKRALLMSNIMQCYGMYYYMGGGSTEGHFPSCSAIKTILFPLICPTWFGRDGSILAFTDLED